MVVESPDGVPILRIRLTATWERSSTMEGAIESTIEYITCAENEKITDKDHIVA